MSTAETLKQPIIEDIDRLTVYELRILYKFIRSGIIARQSTYDFNSMLKKLSDGTEIELEPTTTLYAIKDSQSGEYYDVVDCSRTRFIKEHCFYL